MRGVLSKSEESTHYDLGGSGRLGAELQVSATLVWKEAGAVAEPILTTATRCLDY
jgi:hypothetical protein